MSAESRTHIENQESPFEVDELFVSRTDKRGIILAGNDVFVRVSGFTREQLIGRPHNIIRHKDIPKSVFRLFWNKLKANEPIVAYVKNRAIDGRFYWVLATAFPVTGGYISIRIKPTTPILEKVKELYAAVLEYEKVKGVDAAVDYILEHLKNLGFNSYESFMLASLSAEFQSRDKILAEGTKSVPNVVSTKPAKGSIVFDMYTAAQESAQAFAKASDQLLNFSDFKEKCQVNSLSIATACDRLDNLSVNMSITAHKLGKEGGALSVIASSFQTSAEQMLKQAETFQAFSAQVASNIDSALLKVLSLRLQAEMLAFFLSEIINQLTKGKTSKQKSCDDMSEYTGELRVLTQNVKELFVQASAENNEFFGTVNRLWRDLGALHKQVTRLDLIRIGGKLEGSRTNAITESFKPFVTEMSALVSGIDNPIKEILTALEDLKNAFAWVNAQARQIEHTIDGLEDQIQYLENRSVAQAKNAA